MTCQQRSGWQVYSGVVIGLTNVYSAVLLVNKEPLECSRADVIGRTSVYDPV